MTEKLPYFTSKTDAKCQLFQQMRVEVISTNDTLKQDNLDNIAANLVHKTQLFMPSFIEKLDFYVPTKLCLTLALTVFIETSSFTFWLCKFIAKLISSSELNQTL